MKSTESQENALDRAVDCGWKLGKAIAELIEIKEGRKDREDALAE